MSEKKINEEIINNFISVTGSNRERALFYLEASDGDLNVAIGAFFEEGVQNNFDHYAKGTYKESEKLDSFNEDNQQENDLNPTSSQSYIDNNVSKNDIRNKEMTKVERGKIYTLKDTADESDEEKDDNKAQAFYAGGSETSGQQILGPSKKNSENIIKDLFKKAKEHGAKEVENNQETGTQSNSPIFYGTGYRLGTGEEPSEVVRGPELPKPPKVHVLKLWKNGFTVDESLLRSYEDPANREFLESIERGVPPKELIRQSAGAEVNLDMQDHRDEEYTPPKGKYVIYNDGYKLGSPTPSVISNTTVEEQQNNEELAKKTFNLNENMPVTQVQIRLSNGSRLIIKANPTHKIADLRRYINQARPEYSQKRYLLLMTFPNKEISNEEQTLAEANLLNSVIIQKL